MTVPAQIADLSAHRLGSDVYLQFTIPTGNQDGGSPADIVRVELYGLTSGPSDASAEAPAGSEFVETATLVAAVEVIPPSAPGAVEAEQSAPASEGSRQGERVTVVERLTPAVMTSMDPGRSLTETKQPALPVGPTATVGPLVSLAIEPPLRRSYVAVGISRRGHRGPPSPARAVLLTNPPHSPAAPSVQYTEDVVVVGWQPLPDARRRVQEPAGADVLPATSILNWPPPTTYNVYEATDNSEAGRTRPVPLNASPLETAPYEDSRVVFGVERCYAVRAIETLGSLQAESGASAATCVTLTDTFAPAAPTGLAAVGSDGAISLIWEANGEEDVAGYLILRGRAPGEKLQQLTPTPVLETTYYDRNVQPGVRYVYAVQAVDTATPPNASGLSNRAEESAR